MEPLVLNSPVSWILFLLEGLGAISFAVSGTIIAIKKRNDAVGAVIFALVTAFGGGVIRDLVIGRTPPALFSTVESAVLAGCCFLVSFTMFCVSFIGKTATILTERMHNVLLEGSDMIGLALFCVLGVDSAVNFLGANVNPALLIFCGCITGIGGGILRDIFSAQIPLVFRKHIYLIPALLGTGCYVLLLPHLPRLASILISVSIILAIRILAICFQWNLPTPLGKIPKDTSAESQNGK
ncbi:MAG: trimeric intracellular cation channel family protein [Ruminococcaceae bacterium]|nr:trimeric intracellular cation channel family protein [Oscillospiraceae bacterium]